MNHAKKVTMNHAKTIGVVGTDGTRVLVRMGEDGKLEPAEGVTVEYTDELPPGHIELPLLRRGDTITVRAGHASGGPKVWSVPGLFFEVEP